MASFIGTKEEFHRYVGAYLRNIVQQITRNHKTKISKCEQCGKTENLESAHIKGKERIELINILLSEFTRNNTVNLDLNVFETRFKEAHNPIEETILILCRTCHREYDSTPSIASTTTLEINSLDNEDNDLLPIYLNPSHPNNFKEKLLISRIAEIKTTYLDGRVDSKKWHANKFKKSSDVIGNLRSRPEYRKNNWKKLNIVRVDVTVKEKTKE